MIKGEEKLGPASIDDVRTGGKIPYAMFSYFVSYIKKCKRYIYQNSDSTKGYKIQHFNKE